MSNDVQRDLRQHMQALEHVIRHTMNGRSMFEAGEFEKAKVELRKADYWWKRVKSIEARFPKRDPQSDDA